MNDRPRSDAKEIFLEAVEKHPPREWEAYLDETCGTDAALRALVEALLRAHAENDSLFDDDATASPEATLQRPPEGLGGLSQISLPEVLGDASPLTSSVYTGEAPPERVGRYRIEGEIARGGVGAVYRARDDDLGRSLAVKLLLDDHRRNPGMLQRFLEEAQINGQLQHPGIVPVHDVGLVAEEKPYFAMKLVKGQTLARALGARRSPVEDRPRFLGIFEHVSETIAYAHARGVIHRDLKPSNVMIGSFGEVQVVDWGLAKVLAQGGIADDARADPGATAIATVRSGSSVSDSLAGSILGTPAYMSPEQARGELDELDERSDVFGLGAMLCEILTGKPPYVGGSASELLNQARQGDLEDAWSRLEECGADREMRELASRCLARLPRERPRDGGAVAKEVRDHRESLEERARSMRVRAARARLRLSVALTMTVAIAIGTGAMVWLLEQRRERAAHASAAVASVIFDARELAAAASVGDPADDTAWNHAHETIERAAALITDEVDEETRAALARERTRIEVELERSRMRSRLVGLRGLGVEPMQPQELERRYAATLREILGHDVEEMPTDDAVDLIRATGIMEELAQAIEEWAIVRSRAGAGPEKLFDLVTALDPRPFRLQGIQLLQSPARVDVESFLATGAREASAAYLSLFARALITRGEVAGAETVLKRVLLRELGNFRAAFDLSRLLHTQRRLREALHYAVVAKSLRPDHPAPWWSLGQLLEDSGEYDGALEAFTQLAVLRRSDKLSYEPLRALLEREEAAFGRAALERTVSALSRLVTSERDTHGAARDVLEIAASRLPPEER